MTPHHDLSRELVRSLRGSRSQRQLSRRLQYTANVVYLWESGRRWPTGATFLWLAHRTGVDVGAALDRIRPGAWQEGHVEPWHPQALAAWMRSVQGGTPATELARRLDKSRDAVGRWLRGDAEPRLPDLLAFVEVASTRLLDFVRGFCDPATLPSVADRWARIEAARRLTREEPWAPAILLALELDAYQALPEHDSGWVAGRLALPRAVVDRCLGLLADAGQLRRVGGRWQRVEVDAVDTRTTARTRDLKRWWAQVGVDRLAEAEGAMSFTVCTVSQADFDAFQDLQRQHYRDLRTRIAASSPGERVVLVSLQTLALDRPATVPEEAP